MIRDNGDMESESDRSDCEGMPPLEDSDGHELALPVGESLVIRRTLQVLCTKQGVWFNYR